MNFGLSEKTVLLTGATSGLGRAIAIQLAELGANITLVDKNEDRVQRLATEIMDQREVREEYGRAAAIVSDITKPHHVKEAVRKSAEVFGGIDIYIDALIAANECSIENENLEDLDRMIDVNLKAPFLITNEVVKFLKERRRSRILYIIPDYAAWGGEGESIVAATR
ncbi:MAG: SDR family oxidoreductase, partial [Bdellovibrionales bacterium]|nr:SDR family oxidoreductase [Bdellovibrionales bacterium]